MNKLNKWVRAVLATASTTAALSVGIVASDASAFELRSQINLTSGYRNDNSRFAICSTLSNPDFYGYGQAKFQNVNLWEVQLNGIGAFNDNWYVRALVGYGAVLGGKYNDSGVIDILSDPYNATLGEDYYGCCAGCTCNDECPCDCTCGDEIYHNTVPVTGCLGGSAWDAEIAFGYMFHASEEFGIAPVIGWSFNQQRYKVKNGGFGPLPLQYEVVPGCFDTDESVSDFYNTHLILTGGVATGLATSIQDAGGVIFAGNAASTRDDLIPSAYFNTGCGAPCVVFGLCGDDTTYRARWNGPFIGLDFFWTPSQDWNVMMGYELHYQHLNGQFDSLGGGDCCEEYCGCDYCPGFQSLCDQSDGNLCTSFSPSTISVSSNGWGQVFYFDAWYQVNQNWQVGFDLNYSYANASDCDAVDPCESCDLVCNGAALINNESTVVDTHPIWQNATFKKARWSSFGAQVSVGYLF
jgi:hypothetical protein